LRNLLPPNTVFPKNYDSDLTLFKVYNTTETVITKDNLSWAEEIEILPVGENDPEIWADNGFANISGELLYYDSVEKDSNGKVQKLKNCSRSLGGARTKDNKSGTSIRGYVIAQHHNQLVNAIINLEKYIGTDDTIEISESGVNTPSETIKSVRSTLDWKIKSLRNVPDDLDDHDAPNVIFEVRIINSNSFEGTTIEYEVTITGPYTNVVINFGDGSSTTDLGPNIHIYAPGGYPDPYVKVSNEKTEVIVSPEIRIFTQINNFLYDPGDTIVDIDIEQPDPFEIPLPEIPFIPTFVPPDVPTCENIINTPPIVFPCLNVDIPSFGFPSFPTFPSIYINVPSFPSIFISINVPSIINISPSIPDTINVIGADGIISVTGFPDNLPVTGIPESINVTIDGTIPETITVIPPVIPPITFTEITIPPVQFATPPTLTCIVSIVCPTGGGGFTKKRPQTPLYDFPQDEIDAMALANLDLDNLDFNLPSEIFVRIPEMSDIQLVHDLPAIIRVESPKIPNIKIEVPEFNIPKEIRFNYDGLPSAIELTAKDLPKSILLDASSLPKSIPLDVPKEFPKIKIDASDIPDKIQVTGIPSTIELVGAPSEIKLVLPEKPEVELVYRGAPIDLKINLDIGRLTGDSENAQCVAIVPCTNK